METNKRSEAPMSRSEKAAFILEVFPNLSTTTEGRELKGKLKKILESSENRVSNLNPERQKIGAASLEAHLPSSQKQRPGPLSPQRNITADAPKGSRKDAIENLLAEHPAILLKQIESCDEKQRQSTLKSLPGDLARQISFLLANK